jgi:hypothetical protein
MGSAEAQTDAGETNVTEATVLPESYRQCRVAAEGSLVRT